MLALSNDPNSLRFKTREGGSGHSRGCSGNSVMMFGLLQIFPDLSQLLILFVGHHEG